MATPPNLKTAKCCATCEFYERDDFNEGWCQEYIESRFDILNPRWTDVCNDWQSCEQEE